MFPRESPYLPLLKLVLLIALAMLIASSTSWGPSVLAYGTLLVLLLLIAAFLLMLFLMARVHYRNWRWPLKKQRAVLTRKWTRTYDLQVPDRLPPPFWVVVLMWVLRMDLGIGNSMEEWVFWTSFDVDGEELDFAVPESVYVNLEEHTAGILAYRNERFLYFRPDSPAPLGSNLD